MVSNDVSVVRAIEQYAVVSLPDLADALGVKARTARAYVHHANEALSPFAAITWSRAQGGYKLDVKDTGAFESWKADAENAVDAVLSTSEERIAYLVNDLLYRSEWITLDELSNVLYVSRTSITADLKGVEKILSRFNLSLERKPHYGIRVTGTEMSPRLCLASEAARRATGVALRGEETLAGITDTTEIVSRCVDEVLEDRDFQIDSLAHQNLIVHISVALMRIRVGEYMPMEDMQMKKLCSMPEYAIAEAIAFAIGRELSCDLPEQEIAYMAIHLAGKRTIVEAPEGEGTVVTDEAWDLVSKMLDVVERVYRFDFRDDLELRMNLARHIVPLAVRLTYHLSVQNPLLKDIKARFPLAYSMASDASSVLADHYGSSPSEDEVGYIAMAFALALDRLKTERPKKRILVVCASGRGSARLLEHHYRKEFGPYLESVEVCDATQVPRRDLSHIDYIFTTVPLSGALPVPVREVKYFLDAEDISRVRAILESPSSIDVRARYFDRGLFFPHLACGTKEEAISYLCARARSMETLPDDFEWLVWERERAAATAFGNYVALPHPMNAVGERTFLTVGLLDEPVDWDGQQVQAVFLIVISREGHDDLEEFYEGMAEFFIDPAAIRRLLESQTFETLLALMRRGKEGV